jgi:hypothetical protein
MRYEINPVLSNAYTKLNRHRELRHDMASKPTFIDNSKKGAGRWYRQPPRARSIRWRGVGRGGHDPPDFAGLHRGRQALRVLSPTHTRDEGRPPVWGSEFTTKATSLQGVQKILSRRLNKKKLG